MPSMIALKLAKLSARARFGLAAAGVGFLALALPYVIRSGRTSLPAAPQVPRSSDTHSLPQADVSSGPPSDGPSHALDLALFAPSGRTTRPRRDIFSFVVPASV